jgi:hypothetical protein
MAYKVPRRFPSSRYVILCVTVDSKIAYKVCLYSEKTAQDIIQMYSVTMDNFYFVLIITQCSYLASKY